jgi:hypothetical protein
MIPAATAPCIWVLPLIVPAETMNGNVGIFWVHEGTVLPRPIAIANAECSGDYVDSSEGHVDVWENVNGFADQFPELAGRDYETVPRGRVLYNRKDKRFVIYLDECLNHPATQTKLKNAFGLIKYDCVFKTDPHYVTDPNAIRRLFE